MQKNNGVSIVIVHYGHGNEVFKCLDSLAKVRGKFEIAETILVDNNEEKTDKSKILKDYPWVVYIPASKNLGWSAGHNFGFKKAKGEYIFSLDSDVLIDATSFKNIYEIIRKNHKIGIVSPRVKNISGEPFGSATLELNPLRGIFYLSFIKKLFPKSPIIRKHVISDWNRKTARYAETIQLGAFIIRTKAYEDIGGFDENFFLYFHENDISKRLREKDWKIFFDSKSEAVHLESKWTPKNTTKIKKIWAKCRYYYFKKHYGILPAILVECFARFSKYSLMLLGILALGTFLRFYLLQQNMIFNGEMGYDYMTIQNFVEKHQIPLIGPRTSHEWFFIGPLFYWIFGLLLPLFHYNVAVGAYFFAVVGVASIPVCYFVIKSLFGQKPAIISSFLISFSPLWVALARDARFNAMTAVLFFPFYYLLVKSIKDKGKSLFLLGLALGIMFSFFPSPILLLPGTIVAIFLYRRQVDKKYFLPGILGFLIPNIPYLIYNATHKFEILKNLFIWIPYRILGFVGLYPKNTVTPNILQTNISGLYTFFQQSFLHDNDILIFALSIVVFSYAIIKIRTNLALRVLMIIFGTSYLGLFLHGAPPQHYYLVVFPVPIILLGLLLEKMSKKYFWAVILILGYLLIFNFKFYFSKEWFGVNTIRMSEDMNFVPYSLQIKIVDFIANDSGPRKFNLARVGPLDQFGENFSLNYQFLLRNINNMPDKSAPLKYTIYEDTSGLPQNEKIYWIENVAVSKNE
jgi:GT2 family glycosyltransferase